MMNKYVVKYKDKELAKFRGKYAARMYVLENNKYYFGDLKAFYIATGEEI